MVRTGAYVLETDEVVIVPCRLDLDTEYETIDTVCRVITVTESR